MWNIKSFVFSPIQENTYVLYNETKECLVVDPGCYFDGEKERLQSFIDKSGLKPAKLQVSTSIITTRTVHSMTPLKLLSYSAVLLIAGRSWVGGLLSLNYQNCFNSTITIISPLV
mgnify:CR=1 FL=1